MIDSNHWDKKIKILRDDVASVDERAHRRQWIEEVNSSDQWTYSGGVWPGEIRGEAIEAYISGLFNAAQIMSIAAIEQLLLSQLFHTTESDIGERASIRQIIEEATRHSIIPQDLADRVDQITDVRNGYAHYRNIENSDSLFQKMTTKEVHPDQITQQDAKGAIEALIEVSDSISKEWRSNE